MSEITNEWSQYQHGLDYNNSISYKSKIDKNERFYAGDQWNNVKSDNLPTPVFNIIKRIVDHKVSQLLTQPYKIKYTSVKSAFDNVLNSCANYHWEKDKLDYLLRVALLNGALSGDMCAYTYWNPNELPNSPLKGDFDTEIIDGINVFFGNVNDSRVQTQPYIIIAGRTMTEYLKEEAKANNLTQSDIDKITPDSDYDNQAGDRGINELDGGQKTTYIIKFWKKDGQVFFSKSVKSVNIIKAKPTGLTLYPIAWANWISRKNSYHGEAEVTPLISAQIFYNKEMALAQKSSMDTAYPKLLYDKTRLAGMSNAVGGSYPVNGDATNAARYLPGGQMDANVFAVLKQSADMTYQSSGVTDAMTGEMRPENTSAIIALQKAAATPLDMQKAVLLNFIEDIARIWLDFIRSKYKAGKTLFISGDNGLMPIEIDGDTISQAVIQTRIDVGASTLWSENMLIDTLNNLITTGKVPLSLGLKYMPRGVIPQGLLEEISALEQQAPETSAIPGNEVAP